MKADRHRDGLDSEDRILEDYSGGVGLFDNFIIDNPEYSKQNHLT